MAGPGGSDAAVLRVKGTEKAIAVAVDGNGRHCFLDPYAGGQIAVAEVCRNLSCTGARPLALTDCLNFGNPLRPDIYYQLEECIRGMALASETLDAPVVSGNVSLFNETQGQAVHPNARGRRTGPAGRRREDRRRRFPVGRPVGDAAGSGGWGVRWTKTWRVANTCR